jgi:hypothetical protein
MNYCNSRWFLIQVRENYLCKTRACNYNTLHYFKINMLQENLQPRNVLHQPNIVCMHVDIHLSNLFA